MSILSLAPRLLTLPLLVLATACGATTSGDVSQSPPAATTAVAPTPTEQPRFHQDPAAKAELQRIQAEMARTKKYSDDNMLALKALYERYPDAPEVFTALNNILINRGEWAGLVELYDDTPPAERTTQEQLLLTKAYIKLGRFEDAAEAVLPLHEAAPSDVERAHLAGYALFYLGEYERAAAIYDRVWDRLTAAGEHDGMVFRALIHYEEDELDRAVAILEQVLAEAPDHVAANNALGRVLAARGEHDAAQAYLDHAAELQAANTRRERRLTLLSAQSTALNDAVESGRYDDAERLIDEMLPNADPALQSDLLELKAAVYQQQGRVEEARAALEQAAQVRAGSETASDTGAGGGE